MTKSYKSVFSKADLYHLADRIVDMHTRFKLIYDFAKAAGDQDKASLYYGILFELELLIEGYGLKELVKIN